MEPNSTQVVIAGAGLAGLAAAATAARAGARVLILGEKSPGGRARTDGKDGFRFNRGPHAIYMGGPGRKVLTRLGVRPATHTPPLRGARVLAGGGLHPPLSRRILGARAWLAASRRACSPPVRSRRRRGRRRGLGHGRRPRPDHGGAVQPADLAAAYRMTLEPLASFVPELRKTAAELAIVLPPGPVRPSPRY